MTDKLKPCTHCKGAAKVIYRDNPMSKWKYTAECKDCGAAGSVGSTSKEAGDNWNTRPIEDELKTSRDFAREHNTMHIKAHASLQKMYADKVDELKAITTLQPIDTAPIDGTKVLTKFKKGNVAIVYCFEEKHWFTTNGEFCKPNNWMHIPEFKEK